MSAPPTAPPSAPPRVIREADVLRVLTMPDAIAAVREGLIAVARGEAYTFARKRHRWPGGRMHLLAAAWPARGLACTKTYLSTRGAPGAAGFTLLVYDTAGGALRAVIEAEALGVLRTGALSGVATDCLARGDAATVALIGAGRQALAQLEAVCAVRPGITRARVFSPTPERRERLAAQARAQLQRDVRAVASVDEAVDGADVIVTITTAVAPFLRAAHLWPGMHVNAAGSNDATRAELAPDAVARAARVVVDAVEGAEEEAGDLLQARDAGTFRLDAMSPLGAVLTGAVLGRGGPEEITLFESQGVGIADLAAAAVVLAKLEEGKP